MMKIKVDHERCTGCGVCIPVCPVEALSVQIKATIDTTRCINCRMCLTACPVKAISCR